jgi:hypothetical protein
LHEAWLVCGRRAGKSFILACIAIFIACFRDWRPHLGPGESGTVMIIAADRRQARVIMRYCLGLLKSVPMLKQLIVSETRESIALRNRVAIEVHTASFRSTRGYTIIAALLDEVAYWPTDEASSEPDIEVINAVRPGMATIADAMLLCASSPHARKGALWSAYAKHYAKDGDPILVWQAPTRDMNSTVPQSHIDAHLADDAARASSEYLAMFRSDLEAFVSREVVEACVGDFYELSPVAGRSYYGFVDPAGGSGGDAFALAISHRETRAWSSTSCANAARRSCRRRSSTSWGCCSRLTASARSSATSGLAAFRRRRSSVGAFATSRASRRRATYIVTRCRCSILAASCCPRTTAFSTNS